MKICLLLFTVMLFSCNEKVKKETFYAPPVITLPELPHVIISQKRYFFCNFDWKNDSGDEYSGDLTSVTDSGFFNESDIINYVVTKYRLNTSIHHVIISGLFEFHDEADYKDFIKKSTVKPKNK